MRIGMAIQAVLDQEMRLSLMAKNTGEYRIFPFRQMLRMAGKATEPRVFPALGGKDLQLKQMTLGAISFLQSRLRPVRGKRNGADQQKENCQPAFNQAWTNILFPPWEDCFHKAR